MILGFTHPVTGRRYGIQNLGALDEFIPRGVLQSILYKDRIDKRHKGTNLTITCGLTCPRKTFIQRAVDAHVDPVRMWSAQRGTWLHEQMSHAMSTLDEWCTEEKEQEACEFNGTLFNLQMSCRVDCYKRDYSELWDFKFRRAGARVSEPYETDVAQMNMARLLISQQHPQACNMKMHVWVDSDGWHKLEVPRKSEPEIGNIHPGGSVLSVVEVFQHTAAAFDRWSKGDDAAVVVRSLPMAGQQMYKSKSGDCMCTRYCEYEQICYDLAGLL